MIIGYEGGQQYQEINMSMFCTTIHNKDVKDCCFQGISYCISILDD